MPFSCFPTISLAFSTRMLWESVIPDRHWSSREDFIDRSLQRVHNHTPERRCQQESKLEE
jgi:hypothetical protein